MNINELRESKFLKRADVGDGVIVTITGVTQQNVAKEGAPEELRWILHVSEFEKGLVLNSTNGQLIAQALKSEESDDWVGGKVVLYDDPSVSFGGKLVGGIRVRAVPKASATPAQTHARGSYRPAEGGEQETAKAQLKAKFRAHPEFNKSMKPDDISAYFLKQYGVKLDDLTEEAAQEALRDFKEIADHIAIPF